MAKTSNIEATEVDGMIRLCIHRSSEYVVQSVGFLGKVEVGGKTDVKVRKGVRKGGKNETMKNSSSSFLRP